VSLPLTAGSYVAKKLGDRMHDQAVQRAMDVVGSRSPLYAERYGQYAKEFAKYTQARDKAMKAEAAARRDFLKALAARNMPRATLIAAQPEPRLPPPQL
jgi:hypothetical protein